MSKVTKDNSHLSANNAKNKKQLKKQCCENAEAQQMNESTAIEEPKHSYVDRELNPSYVLGYN